MFQRSDAAQHTSAEGDGSFVQAFAQAASLTNTAEWPAPLVALLAKEGGNALASPPQDTATVTITALPGSADLLAGARQPLSLIQVYGPDRAFLVDTVAGAIQAAGGEIVRLAHPVLVVDRSAGSAAPLIRRAVPQDALETRVSLIQALIETPSPAVEAEISAQVADVLAEVALVNRDFKTMLGAVRDVRAGLPTTAPAAVCDSADPLFDVEEVGAWLDWMCDGNFVFLGVRKLAVTERGADGAVQEMAASEGLGIFRDPETKVLRRGKEFADVTPEVQRFLSSGQRLIITKASVVSRVHRRVHMDYVGITLHGPDGAVTGELRCVGLFTADAYFESIETLPIVRTRVANLQKRLGFPDESYNAKALYALLEAYPRDELLQISVDELESKIPLLLDLDLRPRTTAVTRYDDFDRFVSVLVYVPRDRYTTETRAKIGDHLARAFDGVVRAFTPSFRANGLVRVHFILGRYGGETPRVDDRALSAQIAGLIRDWQDDFAVAAVAAQNEGAALTPAVAEDFKAAFSPGYRADFSPERA
ncbi:MAG: hypothetical protein AAFO79_09610, partial [Pseudomonadota bacterium]